MKNIRPTDKPASTQAADGVIKIRNNLTIGNLT